MTLLPRASAAFSSQLFLSTAIRRNAVAAAPKARFFRSYPLKAAIAHPITAHGPPPRAPEPAEDFGDKQKQQGEQQQAESGEQQPQPQQQQEEGDDGVKLADTGKQTPAAPSRPPMLKKRFWRNADVRKKPGMLVFAWDEFLGDF